MKLNRIGLLIVFILIIRWLTKTQSDYNRQYLSELKVGGYRRSSLRNLVSRYSKVNAMQSPKVIIEKGSRNYKVPHPTRKGWFIAHAYPPAINVKEHKPLRINEVLNASKQKYKHLSGSQMLYIMKKQDPNNYDRYMSHIKRNGGIIPNVNF
jgi:hypothetical protein